MNATSRNQNDVLVSLSSMGILALVAATALAIVRGPEPRVFERVEPVYPPLARAAGVQASIKISVSVGRDGRVSYLKVIDGHPLLNDAAIEAVRQWKFAPMSCDGVADVTLLFSLPGTGAISGKVVDAEGRPLPGIRLQTARPSYWHGRRTLTSSPASGVIDDAGFYRLAESNPVSTTLRQRIIRQTLPLPARLKTIHSSHTIQAHRMLSPQ